MPPTPPMLVAGPTETELKLKLDPGHIDRLRRRSVLSEVSCSEVEVDNVYFDTANRLLHRHRMALRVRQIDGRWLQTLKVEGNTAGSMTRRGEWETPTRVLRGQGRLDVARLAASPLPELLAKQKSKPALRPLFRTRFRRALWHVEHADATIDVALDVGEISADGQSGSMHEPICEVELELKRGEPAALIELALQLLDINGKRPPALMPVARSKAARGYQLVAQVPATAMKASAKVFAEGLAPNSTTTRALRTVVAHGLAVLTANIELLLRYDDPECVHQARVALRRVRSAIRLFDREHRDVPEALANELGWFASALGEARDWDVIADETLSSLADDIGVNAARVLAAKADQRRRWAREKIRIAAKSSRYGALILTGERWCMTPAPAGVELLAASAPPTLGRLAAKLLKAARFFSALTTKRRHRVRIFAKRLRYALDLFAVALPKRATVGYIDALSELQDALGQLNDASVAVAMLPQLSRSVRLKKSVRAWFAAMEPDRAHDAEQRLLKLSTLQTPWK